MGFRPLPEREESIAREIVDAVPNAFGIHKKLGPGLLEKVHKELYCNLGVFVALWLEIVT